MRRPFIKITIFLIITSILWMMVSADVCAQRSKKRKKKKEKEKEEVVLTENTLRLSEQFFTEGEKYFILEDLSRSLTFFQKSLELNPNNAAINYKIAEIYNLNNDFDNALLHASKAVRLQRKNKYYYLLLAEIYTKRTEYGKATEVYEELMNEIEGLDQYLFETAALYIYQEKYDEALSCYDRIEAKYGINEQVIYQKQSILIKTGDLEAVIAEGNKLIEAYPGESQYVANLVSKLMANDLYDEALVLLEKTLENFPDNPVLLNQLAEVYRKSGRIEEAKEITKMIFDDPQYSIQRKMQVVASYFGKELSDEDKEYVISLTEKIVELHPDEPDAYAIFGDLYQNFNMLQEAKNEYLKSIELNPSNLRAWQSILDYELRNSEFDSVIVHAEKAVTYFPNQALIYFYGGTAYLSKNDYKKSVQFLEQGKKMSSTNLQLLSVLNGQLGDAYNGLEEYKQSDDAYEEALDFDPDNDHVLNNYSYFLSLRKDKLDLAEKMASKLIENDPENPTYLDTYAWVLYQNDKIEEAKKYIEIAIVHDEVSGTIFEHYGDILFKLGEIDAAVIQWEKAKELNDTTDLIDKKIADRILYE